MQYSVTYFELQIIIFLVIIAITYLSLASKSQNNSKEQKLKLWNKMISCYEGISLSKDDEILLKLTFKNTLKNRAIEIKNNERRKILTNKKVRFLSQLL